MNFKEEKGRKRREERARIEDDLPKHMRREIFDKE